MGMNDSVLTLDLGRAVQGNGNCSYCGRVTTLSVFRDRPDGATVALCGSCLERVALFKKRVADGCRRPSGPRGRAC